MPLDSLRGEEWIEGAARSSWRRGGSSVNDRGVGINSWGAAAGIVGPARSYPAASSGEPLRARTHGARRERGFGSPARAVTGIARRTRARKKPGFPLILSRVTPHSALGPSRLGPAPDAPDPRAQVAARIAAEVRR